MPQESNTPARALAGRWDAVAAGETLPRACGPVRPEPAPRPAPEPVAEPVPGGRWRVVREGQQTDRRPLAERLTDVFADDGLEVGATFPSASALCGRFDVSRPTVTKALEKLEAAGWLSGGGQGKPRTVRALPNREESSSL